MVFSNLLDNLTNLLSSQDNNVSNKNSNINQVAINELQQGMILLNKRKENINKLKNKIKLIENMDGFAKGEGTLTETSSKEMQILANLEKDYQRQLAAYSTNYKSFMDSYYKAVKDVRACKANCLISIPSDATASSYKRQACKAGCDLKGPYVQECKNTFKKSRIGSNTCTGATKGRCSGGNVVLGMDSTVTSINYADANNVTIKDGCCDCGGGAGGPPTVSLRGKTISNCSQLPNAFGYTGNNGGYMSTSCFNAKVESSNKNSTLFQSYSDLTTQNEKLIQSAKLIYEKINALKQTTTTIGGEMDDKQNHLKDQLAEYGTLYADILARQGIKDQTIDGQLEDIGYKERSQSLHLMIWSGLAILTILLVIQRMRK
jgi:hypothetical protein